MVNTGYMSRIDKLMVTTYYQLPSKFNVKWRHAEYAKLYRSYFLPKHNRIRKLTQHKSKSVAEKNLYRNLLFRMTFYYKSKYYFTEK